MSNFLTARRKNDAVVSVCQNNEQKNVFILTLNQPAEILLKYQKEDLLNKPLTNILNARTIDIINHYLDYTENGKTLLDVLPKIIDFSLINSRGENIPVKIKVFHVAQPSDRSKIYYELLIRDISLFYKLQILRNEYLSGKKYKSHDLFDIPDNNSTILELHIVINFAFQNKISIVVSMMDLGHNSTQEKTKIIIEEFYKNSRNDDFIGYIDDNKILFILIDCNEIYTPQVIHRIYCSINKKLQEEGLSIAYTSVSARINSKELVAKLKNTLMNSKGIIKVS